MKAFVSAGCTALKKGQILLYPTDTIWGIGCDATNPDAVNNIYEIKQRLDNKALICLVSDLTMLEELIGPLETKIKNIALSKKPTTIIYPEVQGLAKNLMAADGSVGIRIVQDEFCQNLIQAFGKPIVSSSANVSGNSSPKEFNTIDQPILDGVDYIVTLRIKEIRTTPSTLVQIDEEGNLNTLRA